jgi:small subunit ribosomal protein S18
MSQTKDTGKDGKRRRRPPKKVIRKRIDINAVAIDFKNTEMLKKFITESGRILPRRITGMPAKLHRRLTTEIKRARNVLLIK